MHRDGAGMLLYEILRIIKACTTLCAHRIAATLSDYFYDRRHGLVFMYSTVEPSAAPSQNGDSAGHQPTTYANLNKLFERLRLTGSDVFVDIGCGKGRVVCFAALRGLRKVIGIELESRFAAIARRNVDALRPRPAVPVEIHQSDAANYSFTEGTVFYFFNPFGYKTMQNVLENLRKRFSGAPHPVRIVYYNPLHAWLLDGADWLERETVIDDTDQAKTVIWRSRPAGAGGKP